MPKKGYRQTPEHRAKIRAMRIRPGAVTDGLASNLRHGQTATPTYVSWRSMRQRCGPSGKYRKFGVSVCARWHYFENFLADMGERPEGTTLDRIDPEGNYKPENCRWAAADQQQRNTRRSNARREFMTTAAVTPG
jgi:hypothetical protein